ncbi:MAG TPA: hypothetical protein VMW72_24480 [Sedimentisphaerales bacterium]|nr:hypothetical protein [Sedimentisphaerales bacterium]
MLDTRYSILDTRYSILDTRYSILDTRYSILDTRYWILDTRYSMLDAGCETTEGPRQRNREACTPLLRVSGVAPGDKLLGKLQDGRKKIVLVNWLIGSAIRRRIPSNDARSSTAILVNWKKDKKDVVRFGQNVHTTQTFSKKETLKRPFSSLEGSITKLLTLLISRAAFCVGCISLVSCSLVSYASFSSGYPKR